MLTAGFDPALAGAPAQLVRSDGVEIDLAVHRWWGRATGEDRWLLDRCSGSAIDLGCGPGRLLEALAARGVPALGVDVSAVAQRACRCRRVTMVRGDLFAPLPCEGRWAHALLADGNIGIGGDPQQLLRRAAELVRPGGTVLVETDDNPDALWHDTVQVRTGAGRGAPMPWARAGAATLARLAATVGLRRTADHTGRRSFVELTVDARVPSAAQTGSAPTGSGAASA
ncbi:class I SAM-dependent methyltransferase [Pseudonocardia nigra]|uniref:class I SAM-dependent methyltransferase n=1 Tax=Pseudonocardia nigra TaxID=1921578 RepID=UPI001C5F74D6|nr:class I SAM-dependent methyltransferase [Pseudonocardia nigra]